MGEPLLEVCKVDANGGLDGDGEYVSWSPGDGEATLDGSFTAAQLRAIADHMESRRG